MGNANSVTLTLREKAAYGVGAIGKDMAFQIVSAFYMVFLIQMQGLNGIAVGVFFMVARLWDAINDPIMGMIVDRTKTKWGKFRPWLLAGTLSNAVIIILMYLDFNVALAGKYVLYFSLYILWGMTYTLMDVPYWSMVPALSQTEKERNGVSALARTFAAIGAAAVTAGIPLILGLATKGVWTNKFFLIAAIVVAVVFAVLLTITVIFTKEKVVMQGEPIHFKDIFYNFRDNDQFRGYTYQFIFYALATTIVGTLAVYYFTFVLGSLTMQTVFMAVAGVGGTGVGMVTFPLIAKKFGRDKTYKYSLILMAAGFAVMTIFAFAFPMTGEVNKGIMDGLLGRCDTPVEYVGLAGLMIGGIMAFFAQGTCNVGSTCMLADTVDYGEWKTGKRTDSITFSMQTLLYKFANAVAALLLGLAASIASLPNASMGEDLDVNMYVPTTKASVTINIVMFLIPCLLSIPAIILYVRHYKFTGSFKEKVMTELYARRNASEAVSEGGADALPFAEASPLTAGSAAAGEGEYLAETDTKEGSDTGDM